MNTPQQWIIYFLLCFAAGAAVAHALYQPQQNALDALKAQIQFLTERKVVGFLVWDTRLRAWRYVEKGR